MEICPRCEKPKETTRKKKFMRNLIKIFAKHYGGLREAVEGASEYCDKCFSELTLPVAQSVIGKDSKAAKLLKPHVEKFVEELEAPEEWEDVDG